MSDIDQRIANYPNDAVNALNQLRALVHAVAEEQKISDVAECLKWGEPSFTCASGSTLRMDWKEKQPDVVSIFVNCKSQLAATTKELYGDHLDVIGNREIQLPLNKTWPQESVKHLIQMALTYHKIKHLPSLGA